ncbi:MAG: cytochrome c, partial [Pseudobdellovibrionaceae bacterium]
LKNPLESDNSIETRLLGQKYYETQCMVCHGVSGKGDGPVAAKMALKPPSLVSDKVRAMKDGRLYHIIVEGQGLMNPYASHIRDRNTRWAVVKYIRYLEGKN